MFNSYTFSEKHNFRSKSDRIKMSKSMCRKLVYILYQNTCKLYCFVLCGFLLMFTNKVKGKVKILNVCDFLQEMWVNYDTIDIVGDRNRQRQLLH